MEAENHDLRVKHLTSCFLDNECFLKKKKGSLCALLKYF